MTLMTRSHSSPAMLSIIGTICRHARIIRAQAIKRLKESEKNAEQREIITSAKGGYVFGFVCLSVCLSVRWKMKKLRTDFDEISWRGRAWPKDQ